MRTMDINECADFLKVHPATAQILAAAGALPGAKIGRSWVFLEDDLIEYLRTQTRKQQRERQANLEVDQSFRGDKYELSEVLPSALPSRSSRRKRKLLELSDLPKLNNS